MNLSEYSPEQTATTRYRCAEQRAENLSILGAVRVLELCVGPSLKTLETAYRKYGMEVVGNDIDARWKRHHPAGKWIIGDAVTIDTSGFDAVVVAPPLSRGCSGTRDDSLSLNDVIPSYYDFTKLNNRIVVYVLPGKTLSVKIDRDQLYRFINALSGRVHVVPLKDKVTKYVDVYREL